MRARQLVVLPAAAALVFTGVASASAHPHHDPKNGDPEATVLDIDNRVHANDAGTRAWVDFKYRCDGDEDDITTTVILRQNGNRLDREFTGRLDCDDRSQWKTVEVRNSGDSVENGRARVTVIFEDENGDRLDRERERVRVRGVDDHDHNHRDHDHHRGYR